VPLFLAPLYLLGAAVAALPVVMHLLHRRKPRPVPFSTLRFLQTAVAKTRRSRHLVHVLILLMRVLILLLIAVAFSRPKLRFATWLPKGNRTVVLVFDASASMRVQRGEGNAFDYAQQWALRLMEFLEEGDRVAVLAPGLLEPSVAFPPISDHASVAAAIEELSPGFGAVDLVSAVRDVLARLEFGREHTGLEVHVFSDFQRTGWDSVRAEDLSRELAGRDLVLFLNHTSPAIIGNAGVSRVSFSPPALVGDGELRTRTVVRASSDFAGENTLRLFIEGEETGSGSFRAQPGEGTTVAIPARVSGAAESLTGRLVLGPDSLDADNDYFFSLPRIAGVPVLLVEGADGSDGGRDTFFLRHAIEPGRRRNTILVPEVADWGTFLGTPLDPYRIVMLSNPASLAGAAAVKLDDFARNGGHVFIFPGEGADLAGELGRLAPLEDLRVRREVADDVEVMRLLTGVPVTPLEQRLISVLPGRFDAAVRKRLRFEELPDAATAYFRYADGTPFIFSVPHGHGSVTVASLGANRDWSEWPLTPFFVIMVQELAKAAVHQNLNLLMTTVGGVLPVVWPQDTLQVDFRLTSPAGRATNVTATRDSVEAPFLVSGFGTPGLFTLSGGGDELRIAVNPPASEGELEYVSTTKLAGDLRAATLRQAASWGEQQQQVGDLRYGRPLWPLLLVVAFFVAIVEELFANYQSRARGLPPGLRRLLAGGGA